MYKGVKHKAKLSNCDKCDYSCTKKEVVMHKLRKRGGQEPPRKLCELCDFTCVTTGGLGGTIQQQDVQYSISGESYEILVSKRLLTKYI